MDKIAVFDFDKTCIAYDCEEVLFKNMLEIEEVPNNIKLLIRERIDSFVYPSVERCVYATKIFSWLVREDIVKWTKYMLADPDLVVNNSVKELYDDLTNKWYAIYIVTASLADIVHIVAEHHGYKPKQIIGSTLEIKDGVYTTEILQLPWFDDKVTMIDKYVWQIPDICVWDSLNDMAMLYYSKQAYVIPSDDRIHPHVEENNRILLEKNPWAHQENS